MSGLKFAFVTYIFCNLLNNKYPTIIRRITHTLLNCLLSQTVHFSCYSMSKTQINQKAWDGNNTKLLN